MLIDLEELAGEIASKVDGAGLTPVIEKEIVHYEIIRSLGRNGLLQDITFQGGTSLRLCYGSQRYSEDLDFVAGDKFDSLPLDDFSKTLRSDLLKSYDTEVSVREPKVVNDFGARRSRRFWPTSSSHSPPPIRISGIATSGISPGLSVRRKSTSLPLPRL